MMRSSITELAIFLPLGVPLSWQFCQWYVSLRESPHIFCEGTYRAHSNHPFPGLIGVTLSLKLQFRARYFNFEHAAEEDPPADDNPYS